MGSKIRLLSKDSNSPSKMEEKQQLRLKKKINYENDY